MFYISSKKNNTYGVTDTSDGIEEFYTIEQLKELLKDEEGLTTVEIILILVVLIALVLIFKEQMTEIVNNIFKTITSQSNKILK